jgi:hypothetical protein
LRCWACTVSAFCTCSPHPAPPPLPPPSVTVTVRPVQASRGTRYTRVHHSPRICDRSGAYLVRPPLHPASICLYKHAAAPPPSHAPARSRRLHESASRCDGACRWCKHLGSTCVSLPPAPEHTSTSDHAVPLNWHLQILQATAGIDFPPPIPLPPTAKRGILLPWRRSPGAGVSCIIGNLPQPFTSSGGGAAQGDAPPSISKFAAAAIALAGELGRFARDAVMSCSAMRELATVSPADEQPTGLWCCPRYRCHSAPFLPPPPPPSPTAMI